ncbi:hypothetical protein HN51_051729 [Arachis hypogaea]
MPGHRDGIRVYWYPWERDRSGLFPSSQGACSPFSGAHLSAGTTFRAMGWPDLTGCQLSLGQRPSPVDRVPGARAGLVYASPRNPRGSVAVVARKATLPLTIPRRVFKSSAKDSTRHAFGIALHGVPQGSSALGVSPTARASGGPGPLLLVGKRAAGARVASSPDSDLEAFSHNPTHGSFAPLAFQPSAMTNCANQRSKGSLGHAFMVRIHTGNQNQTSFYPSVPHEISVPVELIFGHLRYLLTDVPPQPTSPPDNVFRPDRPAEASLGSKKKGNAPPPIHGIIGFPLSVPALSRLFDARGRGPEGPIPNPSPDRHAMTRSRHENSSSSPPTADRFEAGTHVPSPQSQSFSRGYGSILPTFLAYIVPSTRGCSPWIPDEVMSTTGRDRHSVLRIFKGRRGRTGHHATCGALPATGPYLRLSRYQGGQADRQTHVQVPFTWNLSPLRPSKFSFEYLLLPPRSAPTAALPGLAPQVLQRPPRPPTHRGIALAPTAGYRSRASAPSIFGAR